MHTIKALAGAALALGILCLPATAQNVAYSRDFETFDLGSVDGQNGWQGYVTADTEQIPLIVDDPTATGQGKVLCFDPEGDGQLEGAFRPVDDLVALGATEVSVMWDQWRADLGDNMWFADDISYDGWYGLEWDITGRIHPQGFNDQGGAVALAAEQWQTVQIDFDFTNQTIEAFVNGTSGGVLPFAAAYDKFRGIDFELQATGITGDGPLYIDNVRIASNGGVIPEPGTFALLATGVLPLLGLRRRKA